MGIERAGGRGGVYPPEQCLDSHEEFPEFKRLFEIVVGSGSEALLDIVDGALCGKKYDGDIRRYPADLSCHGKTVETRHHHIGHNKVGGLGLELFHSVQAVQGFYDIVSLLAQGVGDNHREVFLIFNKQYLCHNLN